jgi:hypothetical protein
VVSSFGTLWFSSIWCKSWQPVSCGQSQYLPQAVSAHLSHYFWIDVSRVCSPTDVDSDLLVPSMCTVFY